MTPIEKAENSLNRRLEQLQALLRGDQPEATRQVLVQSVVICIGLGEALTEYIRMIGQFAQERHGELKESHAALQAEHAVLLQSGQELLERLKASPSDRAIRKEIERAQQAMEGIQNTLRRGANSLQRDLAPSMGVMEELAESVRRLGEADETMALKRAAKAMIAHTHALYRAQPKLPSREIIDAVTWETLAVAEIEQAPSFNDAFARAGYQALLALELMTLAVSPAPPHTADEATRRGIEAVSSRLTSIASRLAAGS